MALEQMEGFELAGRTVSTFLQRWDRQRVLTYHSSVSTLYMRKALLNIRSKTHSMKPAVWFLFFITLVRVLSILIPGGNLNAASRQALMQKLARIEPAPVAPTVV